MNLHLGARAAMTVRALSLALLLAGAACGPPAAPPAPPPPPASVASLGKYSVTLGRSVAEVLAGAAPPAWLTCGGSKPDIRATAASERQRFALLGMSPALVMAGIKVTLSSANRDGQGGSVFVDARSLTGPNEKVTWIELAGQTGTMRVPFDDRVKLAALAPPLGPDLGAFVRGLAEGCSAPLLEESDLDALPYEVSKDERDAIMVGMRRVKENLKSSCRAAEGGASPWEAHFHHADLVYRGAGHLARVRTQLSVEGTGVCAGPIEIEQIIAGG